MRALPRLPPLARPAMFVAVGSLAALLHWGLVVLLVERFALAPLLANGAGWLGALQLSFGGHFYATFRHSNAPLGRAARRFFLLSAGGFLINESLYAALLRTGGIRYDLALVAVLLLVAIVTYLLSRGWVFLGD